MIIYSFNKLLFFITILHRTISAVCAAHHTEEVVYINKVNEYDE